jgi:hypothetical protein
MFPAMILAIAIVALVQFALYYWRALLTSVASLPVSPQVFHAAEVDASELRGADFQRLAGLYELTPQLKRGASGLGLVSLYFTVVRKIEILFGQLSPVVLHCAEREMILCARYAAVQIDRKLQANLAQAASIRAC